MAPHPAGGKEHAGHVSKWVTETIKAIEIGLQIHLFPSLIGERGVYTLADDLEAKMLRKRPGRKCSAILPLPALPLPSFPWPWPWPRAWAQQSLAGISPLSVQQTLTINGRSQLQETISSNLTPSHPPTKSIRTTEKSLGVIQILTSFLKAHIKWEILKALAIS